MLQEKIKETSKILWMMVAAFGLYFCVYTIRKPFTSGIYEGLLVFGIHYKVVLILTQVIGYMCSKFIGIKVISEIKPSQRIPLILILISIAIISLLLFGIVPAPYNIPFIFFNGLPLGMLYGLIFSFLEGRRATELLGISLSINLVLSSGLLKSVYLYLKLSLGISEMLIPICIAILSIPFVLLFVYMLSKISPPNKQDIAFKSVREPMTKLDKSNILKTYGFGLICMAIIYTTFTILRDFRDNFSIEIYKELNPEGIDLHFFAKSESIIALVVMIIISLLIFIKGNFSAYRFNTLLIFISIIILFRYNISFKEHQIRFEDWYILTGFALFLPYLLIQTGFFDRLLSILKLKGNVGFLIYICDSFGYFGSVILMLIKEFWFKKQTISYSALYLNCSLLFAFIGILALLFQFVFFEFKMKQKDQVSEVNPIL
jgi:hypothetical protein